MIKQKKLSNGINVVYDQITHVKSVCVGVWIKAGSRNETEKNSGIAHFIEHMLFKGTTNRSSKEIAMECDGIGARLNAFTGKEVTCLYAQSLDEHVNVISNVLSDMLVNSTFDKVEIEKEKKVVLEEIAMYNDSPEDFTHEKLQEHIWNGTSIAHPILGYTDVVKSFTNDTINDFMGKYYNSNNIIISVAGSFDEEELFKVLEKDFSSIKTSDYIFEYKNPEFIPGTVDNSKEIEQSYISMVFEAMGYENNDKYALIAASNILGGTMSSRLFQSVREKQGLVYSIGSSLEAYNGCGVLSIEAGMNKANIDKVINTINLEIESILKDGFSDDEITRSKEQLKGSLIMSLEGTNSRMSSMARSLLLRNVIITQEELIKKIDNITKEKIHDIIKSVFNTEKKAISILRSK